MRIQIKIIAQTDFGHLLDDNDEIILYSLYPTIMIEKTYIDVARYLEKLLGICEHIQILNIKTEYVHY